MRVALSPESDSAARYRYANASSPRSGQPSSRQPLPSALPTPSHRSSESGSRGLRGLLIALLTITIAGIGGWVGYRLLPEDSTQTGEDPSESEAQTGRSALEARRSDLGIDSRFLITITDRVFYERY